MNLYKSLFLGSICSTIFVISCDETTINSGPERCGGVLCNANEICLNNICQQPAQDNLCGGIKCSPDELCFNQICQDRSDTSLCGGIKCLEDEYCSDDSCVRKENANNCGGIVCNSNESCIYQKCLITAELCGAVICQPNETCLYNTCIANTELCAGVLCSSAESCLQDKCVPNSALCNGVHCAPTQACINNTCVDNSTLCAGTQCTATQTCINNDCVDNSTLCAGKQCTATQTCINNACVDNSTLCAGKQCTATQTCINTDCVDNSTLCAGKQCASNETCINNVCQVPNPYPWAPDCKPVLGRECVVIPSTTWPYRANGNTSGGTKKLNTYTQNGADCNAWMVSDASNSANVSEAGPEVVYVLKANEAGVIAASVTEPAGGDVDIHLLSALDQTKTLARGDKYVMRHVAAGVYYIVVDTYSKDANAGAFTLSVFFIGDSTKCGVVREELGRYNSAAIEMPQGGRIAMEAHIVSTSENVKPSTATAYLSTHYSLSAKYYNMNRVEPWCPLEGGDWYGVGSSAKPPIEAEVFYINMYWKPKPANGERWIVFNPINGKAVVGAAGYETGPGDAVSLGGAVEEIHHYLGTKHASHLMFGRGKHQSTLQGNKTGLNNNNPGGYGPIDCFN